MVPIAARGIIAPRRTRRTGSVGMQASVLVVFLVTVLRLRVLMVAELLAFTFAVMVLLGATDIVALIVVEAIFGVTVITAITVDPLLCVSVVGLRLTVCKSKTVVVPLTVITGAFPVVVVSTVVVALITLLLVTASGVIIRPVFSVTKSTDVEVTSEDVYRTVVVSFLISVVVTSARTEDTVDVTLITVVEVASGCVRVVLAVSLITAVEVVYTVEIAKGEDSDRLEVLEAEVEDDEALMQV